MAKNKRVVRFRKRRRINIGIITFVIMFIYIVINVYLYFTKDHLSIYKVHSGSNAEDNVVTGIILREEKIVHSIYEGYMSYFQKDGARVAKNASVYSVDDSNEVYEVITSGEIPVVITNQHNDEIKYDINKLHNALSKDDFSYVYEFKEEAVSTIQDLINTTVMDSLQQKMEEHGIQNQYAIGYTDESGIISYTMDSMETITESMVTKDLFKKDGYEKRDLRTRDYISINTPVYKLVTSDQWSIIIPLNYEQYRKLSNKERVTFKILKDDLETTADLTLYEKQSNLYAKLSMDKHISNYIADRFIELELYFDSVDGLKIPKSSIVEKEFFVVPLEYFSMGANSDKRGLTVEEILEGKVEYRFVPTDIYYEDETSAFIDANQFETGTRIRSTKTNSDYLLLQTGKLKGVYNVNEGFAVFKRIEIISENDEYVIVKKNTENGLAEYDHIALDGKTAVEEKIIY